MLPAISCSPGAFPALTFSAPRGAHRSGRSHVYSYFRIRGEVVVPLCEDALPRVAAVDAVLADESADGA